MPDRYGDRGSNTARPHRSRCRLAVPTLRSLGLGRVVDLGGSSPRLRPHSRPMAVAEMSPGKDSVTGHWELMGLVLEQPFPVFHTASPRS
jgi:phosphopentomutase